MHECDNSDVFDNIMRIFHSILELDSRYLVCLHANVCVNNQNM